MSEGKISLIGVVPPPDKKENKLGPANMDPSLTRMQTMDYSCPICFETMAYPIKTPCGHIFCLSCMKDMAKRPKFYKCPTCTRDLKSFKPQRNGVDKDLSKHFADINSRRVAAGLATPDTMLSVYDLPNLPSEEALRILAKHQLENGLRPLRNTVVRKIKSTMISRFKLQAFVEKRTTFWKKGSIGSVKKSDQKAITAAAAAANSSVDAVWSLPVFPPSFFKEGSVEISIIGTEQPVVRSAAEKGKGGGEGSTENDDAKSRHIGLRADFAINETTRLIFGDTNVDIPDEKIKEFETGLKESNTSWNWHVLPPGDHRIEATKGVVDKSLENAIHMTFEENISLAKTKKQRILARRQAIRFYRVSEVSCEFGRTRRQPFMFTVLQTYFSTDDDLSNEAAGGSSSASGGRGGEGRRGAQTLLWYQDYPVEPACCSIS
mmetsp:Transcript_19961/g.27717  ORF Transcript_19961/g.27717 Transcript_19961/m.27717 type:complete len:434 (-) Transcript_19961:178-1479(-)